MVMTGTWQQLLGRQRERAVLDRVLEAFDLLEQAV